MYFAQPIRAIDLLATIVTDAAYALTTPGTVLMVEAASNETAIVDHGHGLRQVEEG